MFQEDSSLNTLNNSYKIENKPTINSLNDEIFSLTHRLTALQQNLSLKMDRIQCLNILERKVNINQMRKSLQDFKQKIEEDKMREEQNITNLQNEHSKNINRLMDKLAKTNSQKKQAEKILSEMHTNNKNLKIVKPQQLYLNSNETMFSFLIQQLNKLKNSSSVFQKQLDLKNKNTISLNNEVCRKLQKIQSEIQAIIAKVDKSYKTNCSNWSSREISQAKQIQKFINKQRLPQIPAESRNSKVTQYENLRFDVITNTLENVQRQLVNKINLKDVMSILAKNTEPFQEEINNLKNYIEESLQSMRKILLHQSDINQQLCAAMKVGWWQSFQQNENSVTIWDKQLINMYPQGYQYQKGINYLTILMKGTYLIKIFSEECHQLQQSQVQPFLLINNERFQILTERVIQIDKNSRIELVSSYTENIIYLQKL